MRGIDLFYHFLPLRLYDNVIVRHCKLIQQTDGFQLKHVHIKVKNRKMRKISTDAFFGHRDVLLYFLERAYVREGLECVPIVSPDKTEFELLGSFFVFLRLRKSKCELSFSFSISHFTIKRS